MQAEKKMTSSLSDYDAITRTVQIYIDGGNPGFRPLRIFSNAESVRQFQPWVAL